MTANDFAALCAAYMVDPSLAIENDDVCEALANDDWVEVQRLLNEEF